MFLHCCTAVTVIVKYNPLICYIVAPLKKRVFTLSEFFWQYCKPFFFCVIIINLLFFASKIVLCILLQLFLYRWSCYFFTKSEIRTMFQYRTEQSFASFMNKSWETVVLKSACRIFSYVSLYATLKLVIRFNLNSLFCSWSVTSWLFSLHLLTDDVVAW